MSASACATIATKAFDAFNAAIDDIIAIDTVLKPHIETVKYREMDVIARLSSFGSLKDAIENVWKRYRDIRAVNDDMMGTVASPAAGALS